MKNCSGISTLNPCDAWSPDTPSSCRKLVGARNRQFRGRSYPDGTGILTAHARYGSRALHSHEDLAERVPGRTQGLETHGVGVRTVDVASGGSRDGDGSAFAPRATSIPMPTPTPSASRRTGGWCSSWRIRRTRTTGCHGPFGRAKEDRPGTSCRNSLVTPTSVKSWTTRAGSGASERVADPERAQLGTLARGALLEVIRA